MRESWRLFTGLELSASAKDALSAATEAMRGPITATNWTPPERLHLTLQFMAQVPVEALESLSQRLREATRPRRPFTLALAGEVKLGRPMPPGLLWAGLAGDVEELMALEVATREAIAPLGLLEGFRGYRPHLTLARKATGDGTALCLPKLAWPVSALTLFRSELLAQGARYTALERFDLEG